MARVVSLLRGINVGGARQIKMPALRDLYVQLGFEAVESYVQSGNLAFDTADSDLAAVSARIEAGIADAFGLPDVDVMVRDAAAMSRIVDGNPFRAQADADPKTVHVAFLKDEPEPASYGQLGDDTSSEQLAVGPDAVVYLLLPDGIGRSKLAASVLRVRGPAATVRNWRTTVKLLDMVGD